MAMQSAIEDSFREFAEKRQTKNYLFQKDYHWKDTIGVNNDADFSAQISELKTDFMYLM